MSLTATAVFGWSGHTGVRVTARGDLARSRPARDQEVAQGGGTTEPTTLVRDLLEKQLPAVTCSRNETKLNRKTPPPSAIPQKRIITRIPPVPTANH